MVYTADEVQEMLHIGRNSMKFNSFMAFFISHFYDLPDYESRGFGI